MRKLTTLLIVLGLLILPAAASAMPTRTVTEPESFVIPPGFGCPFAVSVEYDEDSWSAITTFHDGVVMTVGNADITFTNLDTHTSVDHDTNAHVTQTFDPDTNTVQVVGNGSLYIGLLAGHQGPDGVVGESGALFSLTGYFELTIDPTNGAVTSFSYEGTVSDLCDQLSG